MLMARYFLRLGARAAARDNPLSLRRAQTAPLIITPKNHVVIFWGPRMGALRGGLEPLGEERAGCLQKGDSSTVLRMTRSKLLSARRFF